MADNGNGENVTRRELRLELRSVRLELRLWMVCLVGVVLFKLQVPQTITAFIF